MFKQIIIITIIFLITCFFQSCWKEDLCDRVLFDFETELELDRLNWKCHTLFSLSNKYSSSGLKSLKVELYPSDYPGVSFRKYEKNWAGFHTLCLDLYNPENHTIDLIIRIDDTHDNLSYSDRFNGRFILNSGANNLKIPFLDMKTSGTQRKLNIQNIYKLIFFVVRPEKKTVLFIDNIRLTKNSDLSATEAVF